MQPNAFRRPTTSSAAAAPDAAFEPNCFDFSAYLARRLGVDRQLSIEVLGQWLRSYEPAEQPDSLFAPPREAPPRESERPSGVQLAVATPELHTGTDG